MRHIPSCCVNRGFMITCHRWLFVLILCIRNEPERRHPHAAAGRPPLARGRCTCPSCHKWLSRSQSFPDRGEDSVSGETLQMTHKTLHSVRAQSHLPVYVAVSVNVVKVKGPLKLFSQCSSQQDRQTRDKVLAAMGQNTNSDSEHIAARGSKDTSNTLRTLNLMEPLFAVSNALKR